MLTSSITKNNFSKEVNESRLPVLIEFWSPWCSACLNTFPIITSFVEEMEGKLKFVTVNVDEEEELASAFQIKSVPTFAVIKSGKLTALQVGFGGKEALRDLVYK